MLALLFLFLAGGQSISATEFGGGAYPNGAEDFMAGAVPPPGNYFINYFTYVGNKGLDVSAKFMYDVNTENEDTGYQSGQEFHVDYTIGQKVKNFSFGLGGYYYFQTTDDKLNGIKVGDGFRGEVFAIGPEVKFDCGKTSFILKYQKETASEYRPEGDKLWFKLVHAF